MKVALPSGSFAVGAVIAIAVRATLTVVELVYVGIVTMLGRREAESDQGGRAAGPAAAGSATAGPGSRGAER